MSDKSAEMLPKVEESKDKADKIIHEKFPQGPVETEEIITPELLIGKKNYSGANPRDESDEYPNVQPAGQYVGQDPDDIPYPADGLIPDVVIKCSSAGIKRIMIAQIIDKVIAEQRLIHSENSEALINLHNENTD